MSSHVRHVVEVIPPAAEAAWLLDLGGGSGHLRSPAGRRGYRYVNIDLVMSSGGEPTLIGDAHHLPFRDEVVDVVVSKETLEHFTDPARAVAEVFRVLRPGGLFVILVPFMHPFHGDDLYRYSPVALRRMLRRFEIRLLDSPLWVFTVAGLVPVALLQRLGLGAVAGLVRDLCARVDGLFMRGRSGPASFAAAYRIVARKPRVAGR